MHDPAHVFGCPGCGKRQFDGGDCACGDILCDTRSEAGRDVLIESDDQRRAKFLGRLHVITVALAIVLTLFTLVVLRVDSFTSLCFGAIVAILLGEVLGRRFAPARRFGDLYEQKVRGVAVDVEMGSGDG